MTFTTRRILRVAIAAAIAGMMATASGCAKRTQPASPAAAAPDARPDAGASASDTDASALSVDDQVREALLRYLFEHDGAQAKDWARVYFLATVADGKRDPSPALMQRFASHRPRVERASLADISFDKGAVHRYTREQGVVFTVVALKRLSDGAVEAECEYYAGNLSASGATYRVERKNGVWIVMQPKMIWVA
jgi:hypothetical protein